MKIDVKKTAKLANLNLTSQEEKTLEAQLNDILSYVEKIDSLDVKDITPTSQVTGLENVTFNDKFSDDSLSQEEALSGSTNTHNGMFKVKAVLES
ncbi:MAG: Asp-tRNA(Asn)/Glu-tRNA(Gln) amidotransferase subunit GatC [Candidatus Levybacteria bacterium]|nr:Asp-tRNA(Asn)/Glu-tRNA(Gln) amidotransferase subunit GatC [Candidatus Levybacteria bacterium]